MENLVGVRVADSAEQMRIGQRAFERVIVTTQSAPERLTIDLEHVDAAGIVFLQRRRSAHDEQRCLPLRSGLREKERTVAEVECEKADLPWNPRASLLPAKPARNHQMQNQKQLPLQLEHDALAEALQADDRPAFHGRQRRIDGPKEKRRCEPDPVDTTPDDARRQRMKVEEDVW